MRLCCAIYLFPWLLACGNNGSTSSGGSGAALDGGAPGVGAAQGLSGKPSDAGGAGAGKSAVTAGDGAGGTSGGSFGAAGRAATGGSNGDGGFAPSVGKTALLIGQSGRRAHVDYVLGTGSTPAGGSVYAELYTGKFLSFEQGAFVDYLSRYYPGSLVEVGFSWKDNRVNAGYCDLSKPDCVASGGAVAPELDIVAGKYDQALQRFGKLMQSYDKLKFLLRVDYEVSPNLHCAPADKDACPAYQNAFRYLKELWTKAGVKNVELVFHPTRGWAKQMYPGPDVTDWIAFSVFNHDLCLPTPEGTNGGCKAGAELDSNLEADLAWAEQQGKPVLIAESTVQKPSDDSAAGFNEYLTRLLGLVEERPQVRGVTYINMKWAGAWIYGEDWTTGAFGNADARIAHFPETRAFFCQRFGSGRFVALGGSTLGCDEAAPPKRPALPPNLDAPAVERAVVLGSNRCVSEGKDAIVQRECDGLSETGEARLRLLEVDGKARIWSDVSWSCWSAEGDAVVPRPCADVAAQRFQVEEVPSGGKDRDLRLLANDGRCLGAAPNAPAGTALVLGECGGAVQQTFRL